MLFAYGKIWDLRDVRHPRQVTSARQAALWVAFSADGKTLAEFDDDGLASLYHIGGSGGLTLTGRLPVFGGVASMAFSQNGDLLTVMYVNRPVQLWSVKGRRLLATLPNSSSATFSPDGRTLAVADTEDRTVQLLNTTNPRRPALTAALTGVLAPIVFPRTAIRSSREVWMERCNYAKPVSIQPSPICARRLRRSARKSGGDTYQIIHTRHFADRGLSIVMGAYSGLCVRHSVQRHPSQPGSRVYHSSVPSGGRWRPRSMKTSP
jgi:WD40 repeat protein